MLRFVFGLLALLLLATCGGTKQAALPPGSTVLILGDSLSYGTGAARGEDYPGILATTTGWNIVNAGVPGDTTAGGLERLPGLLEQHAPQLLLVELGGNDFLHRIPQNQTESNLKAILAHSRSSGVPVLLLAVPTPSLFGAAVVGLSDDPLFERIATETETPLIRDVLAEVLSKQQFKSDAVHANADGYRKIADGLYAALKDIGYVK